MFKYLRYCITKMTFISERFKSFALPQLTNQFNDQFAFRPTGSTTAALISLFHHITSILAEHTHVHIIALDFSKAFDSVRHSALASKLAPLPLPDCIHNWLLNFLSHRKHCTRFGGLTSRLAEINASFVQGSITGPTNFVIDASDLKALKAGNINPKIRWRRLPNCSTKQCSRYQSWAARHFHMGFRQQSSVEHHQITTHCFS